MLTFNRKVVVAVLWPLLIGFSLGVFGQEDISAIKFSLRSIDGGNVTDADVRGKVVVFITTSRRLPVRAGHVASFRNLMRDYSSRGVDFYLVSTDSESRKSKRYVSDEQLRQFTREIDLPLKALRDPGGATMRKYGRDLIPLIVVLDKQGRVDGKPIEGYGQRSAALILRPQLARLTR
jgi:peroxiredoxin